MKSLLDRFPEQKKSYYQIDCNAEKLFTYNFEESQSECLEFLNRHYEKGEKKALFNRDLTPQYNRRLHNTIDMESTHILRHYTCLEQHCYRYLKQISITD